MTREEAGKLVVELNVLNDLIENRETTEAGDMKWREYLRFVTPDALLCRLRQLTNLSVIYQYSQGKDIETPDGVVMRDMTFSCQQKNWYTQKKVNLDWIGKKVAYKNPDEHDRDFVGMITLADTDPTGRAVYSIGGIWYTEENLIERFKFVS